ncbi:precorrin-3B synthase [Hyphomicrobium sp. LHD-15]|uniref:precorrin-3B synthase n=1 Tax=Hyphomicrobium sp. LHD-15 TaxID=3072142 RepID=UPI0028101406|nr:precorrin-3B synthase [Hyphomicrobium sp. LHD-15]MDQ8699170.1 precorrin-3B synthase [Hyphomicrobium sp. LHD-15]
MRAQRQNYKKGWCPGVRRPMETGDGQIVRIRPRGGCLRATDLTEIASLSRLHGNGLIDLTRRANVQMRGLTPESFPALVSELDRLGLADETEAAEAARNVMVNPLAGLDPAEVMDVRPLARAVEEMLSRKVGGFRFSGKFGFVVDGGGRFSLDDERADIRIRAVGSAERPRVAIGIDGAEGVLWLRLLEPGQVLSAVERLIHAFVALTEEVGDVRMVDVPGQVVLAIVRAVERFGEPAGALEFARTSTQKTLGAIVLDDGPVVVGLAAPFGRVEAEDLLAVAERAIAVGASEFRVSPWRSFYIPVPDEQAAQHLSDYARSHGFLLNADEPLLSIDACPGSPACASSTVDTRAAARALAPLLGQIGCVSAHVSGCNKGCARSKPADLVLIGEGEQFRVVRNGTINGPTVGYLPPDNIQNLVALARVF